MLKSIKFNSNIYEKKAKTVFIEEEGKINEYQISLNHMSVVDAIESYIKNISIYEFVLANEKQVKLMEIPIKFLPYMGKFKLENRNLQTKNYLTPVLTYFLNFLLKKYKDNSITNNDLKTLYELKKQYEKDSRLKELQIIEELIDGIDFNLINTYDFNEKVGQEILLGFENVKTTDEFKIVLEKIRELIYVSTINKKYTNELNIINKKTKTKTNKL